MESHVAGGGEAARRRGEIFLFVYGTLRIGGVRRAADAPAPPPLEGCTRVRAATVHGTLYHLDTFPALVLAGTDRVAGEVWRAPAGRLPALDAYEGVADGLFRRVALEAAGLPCWTYVAGPALARRLTPGRRIASGNWTGAGVTSRS